MFARGSNIPVAGEAIGSHQTIVDGGATLEFKAAASIAVDLGQGVGTLALGDSADFTGIVKDFGAGDALELADIDFASASWSFAANQTGTGGVLTLVDADSATNLVLQGLYDPAQFSLTADDVGHTRVTYHDLIV
ncbi:hypothetical protein NK718_21705 [Alsobacter sp. SYSU M60028]|uniref:Uncharacterized protein n=1 Tax=Alsobacter ponti TaxID=2962936 RepID=A0ABT1LI12_9HYPH|nr:hypothetical protein [Alsobacter ponti]MCP8941145.1 hypothetical protein [Alsobacter ponti]